ncbi:CIH_HP2_G0022100.mRNA.1.CDS.1 [Saccharomyces cerevisiae]|nr:CIH_HP2_G0022100.mRNA.1.CDS.1 [Saccharomyces cerevisiae]CAI6464490.1 CIH_HP2_G0022100.mRNA.1.CDS.1 [Saccharomyces cerevisiae]CAI6469976.1 CIH_HP1_G0022710.mRNA.1.CDS.1 [Saccharomyces cerevisiae]CAI7301359.1 CIH_collapsed_G0020230.mRNA.1.CDS.1 [Saccharomyces cerevisiae]
MKSSEPAPATPTGFRNSIRFIIFYLFVIQALGSAIISGGIEFAIAYAMYHSRVDLITLWAFPHTISGDCALSLFIQVGLTWASEEILVGFDDYKRPVFRLNKWITKPSPLKTESNEEIPPPKKRFIVDYFESKDNVVAKQNTLYHKHNWLFGYLEVNRGIIPKGKEATLKGFLTSQFIHDSTQSKFMNFIEWFVQKFIRSMILAIAMFIVIWPVTMGILAGIGHKVGSHDYYFNDYPLPQVMKLIYAVVIAFVCTPVAIIVIVLRNQFHEELYYEGLANGTLQEDQEVCSTGNRSSGSTDQDISTTKQQSQEAVA